MADKPEAGVVDAGLLSAVGILSSVVVCLLVRAEVAVLDGCTEAETTARDVEDIPSVDLWAI